MSEEKKDKKELLAMIVKIIIAVLEIIASSLLASCTIAKFITMFN